jgi:RNA pseudouridylate synthase
VLAVASLLKHATGVRTYLWLEVDDPTAGCSCWFSQCLVSDALACFAHTHAGVVVFGKTLDATRHVHAQFRRRTVEKRYLALVAGVPESADFVVEAPIDRHPVDK